MWRTSSGWIAMMTGRLLLLADLEDPVEHRPVADVEGRDREVVLVGDVEDGLAGRQHVVISPVWDGLSGCGGQALDGAGGEAADEVALEEEEQEEHRECDPRMLIAIISFHSYECCPMSSWMPIGTVRMSSVRVRVRAKRNSFHAIMKV